jgi:hypothetical protein
MSSPNFRLIKSDIQSVAKTVVESEIGPNRRYDAISVKPWAERVIDEIYRRLRDEKFQNFKYLVNCLVLSPQSHGLHTVTMSLWNDAKDGSVTAEWSNDSMKWEVTVWAFSY